MNHAGPNFLCCLAHRVALVGGLQYRMQPKPTEAVRLVTTTTTRSNLMHGAQP